MKESTWACAMVILSLWQSPRCSIVRAFTISTSSASPRANRRCRIQSLYKPRSLVVNSSGWKIRKDSRFVQMPRPLRATASSPPPPGSSPSSSSSFDRDKLAHLQSQASQIVRASSAPTPSTDPPVDSNGSDNKTNSMTVSSTSFLEHQRQVFDELAVWFASEEAITSDLIPNYEYLAKQIVESIVNDLKNKDRGGMQEDDSKDDKNQTINWTIRLLDVGCGTGAMFPFYDRALQDYNQQHGTEYRWQLVGLDLSPKMIEQAQQKWITNRGSTDTCSVDGLDLVVQDILQYSLDDQEHSNYFDAIVFNAVFGNLLDPHAVLEHVAQSLLSPHHRGRIYLTHPLGSDCVQYLHKSNAETVPHLLPTLEQWQFDSKLLLGLPLVVVDWQSEVPHPSTPTEHPLYYASLQRVRYRTLPQALRLRGKVDAGFGRGGKQLGFPTANLGPSHAFAPALSAIETGVYLGWAVIEWPNRSQTSTEPGIHKAVVNVGYSPTFEQQNPVRIVEAHLILDEHEKEVLDDFYNQTMRLQLIGFLRPELKFPNFPALIAQITADRNDATEALDRPPYATMRYDSFLTTPVEKNDYCWIGSSGGDESASWEFAPLSAILESIQLHLKP